MNRFDEIQRRAYQKYQERLRRGLIVDFEPDRTRLEKRDWHWAEIEYEEQGRQGLIR